MEEKDNVYINTGAEEIATANAVESTGRTENTEQASTALGKFKANGNPAGSLPGRKAR